jgi:hypothetical protein
MSLTEGTEEWNKQVLEVNQSVAKLLSQYPELEKFINISNGVMTLSKEGQDELIKKQELIIQSEE